MSVECQRCESKSQLFLCGTCQRELREMLTGLAHGDWIPTGSAGRTASGGAWCIERRHPGWLEHLEDAVLGRTRLGESARRSTERNTPIPVNLGASQLLDDTHALLAHWCETISTKTETLTITGEQHPKGD